MNEKTPLPQEEIIEETAKVSEAADTKPDCAEQAAESFDPLEEISALRAENTALKRQLFCARCNIPPELAEDMICIAQAESEKNGTDFEEALKSSYLRLTRLFAPKSPDITTGAAVKSSRSFGADPLRAAFGLK